ncbi:hypothetical protein [Novosphingobium sp. EMRT-2]|uniref:hypothetical protein n=1 Tax=Novosphingobium sp. EMRT-2 TaxID=2571749 RepID=UPI0010BD675F|nr:hypothetical protein [Novosphingobium sp. EMRT-2]QCI93392.1 hypothetical protein FA702_07370 [Novosphingobium sp. EMRT-2]
MGVRILLAMSIPILRAVASHPIGSLLISTAAALLLGSLATAGLNTLFVARLMIAASFLLCLSILFFSVTTKRLTRMNRFLVAAVLLVVHVGLERAEAWYTPKPKRLPVPPLLLLLEPPVPGYIHPETLVPGLPLATTCIKWPVAGYANFGKVGDVENDDVMLGISSFDLRNLTDRPLRLSWELTIKGEGLSAKLSGDGKGRWERQLNKNDLNAQNGGGVEWTLSPVNIPPKAKVSVPFGIGFVAPNADDELRAALVPGALSKAYDAAIIFHDLDTGRSGAVSLPFGQSPIDSGEPIWSDLHNRLKKMNKGEPTC